MTSHPPALKSTPLLPWKEVGSTDHDVLGPAMSLFLQHLLDLHLDSVSL